MTHSEISKLDTIINQVERLLRQVDDTVARAQLYEASSTLLNLYNSARRDYTATEKS